MNILYPEEHNTCENFVGRENIGFKNITLEKGSRFCMDNSKNDCSIFMIDGKISLKLQGKYNAEMGANDMCLVPKGWTNSVVAEEDCSFVLLIWTRTEKLCDKVFFEDLPLVSRPKDTGTYVIKQHKLLKNVIQQIRLYIEIGMGCKHMHKMKQDEVLLIIRSMYDKKEAAKFFATTMLIGNDFVKFVLSNYKNVKSVKELAAMYNGSIRSFNRKFSENFNESPYKWMTMKKTEEILEHISDVNYNMQEIAYKFGFSSASHFTRFFVQTFGETPTKMRQRTIKGRK
ncbi:MAG: AraC family transcriptional regulator [Bacteroides sp.]|nr:AraC family transcriptional regulator [Bacteroides sp.]